MNDSREQNRILIVEDDRALRDGVAMNLRMQGYDVVVAADGDEGMRLAFDARPDMIILDIMLPGWTGLEILQALRERAQSVPVLILSARQTTGDRVAGLELGADDYMVKPFDLPELIARVKAMLRRRHIEEMAAPLSFGDVTVDRKTRTVTIQGREISMSATEFDLLCLLASSPGQVFTRETILERVWGWDYDGTARTVDNFIARLRQKLGDSPRTPRHIKTIPRVGYKLVIN